MFCSSCGVGNDDNARFCKSCGTSLTSGAPAVPAPYMQQVPQQFAPPPPPLPANDPRIRGYQQPVPTGQKVYVTGKSPGLALILSLIIVGLGQFYNGDAKKGAIMLVSAVILGILTLSVAWFGIAIWSAIDAYNVASGKSPIW